MIDTNELLALAVEKKASDIFITVGIPPTLKIEGNLVQLNHPKLTPDDAAAFVKKMMQEEDQYQEFLEVGDKDFSISLAGVGRFRIVAYRQRGSVAARIRVVNFAPQDFSKLRIPQTILDLSKKSQGLILITGPPGSGKSTTLSAMISLLNKTQSVHIITLEDPISFLHKHDKSIIDQREIGLDAPNYVKALRSAMRQAPDVILIGELRDYETISTALMAAENGHLVLSTLPTSGISSAIDRIVDVFPGEQQQQIRVQLAATLEAIVSQELIPCSQGGRTPAFEIMTVDPVIRQLIREGQLAKIETLVQKEPSEGMVSMDHSIGRLYQEGLISKEDAMFYSVSQERMTQFLYDYSNSVLES